MPISLSAVGCVNAGTHRYAATIHISPLGQEGPNFTTNASILNSLTAYTPSRVAVDSNLEHLSDLPWADKDLLSAKSIDLIIGADLYGDLLLDSIRRGAAGQPIAQNTVLEWVISSPCGPSSRICCPTLILRITG